MEESLKKKALEKTARQREEDKNSHILHEKVVEIRSLWPTILT